MNYARVIDEIFGQLKGPRFSVKLWDGREYVYGEGTAKTFTLIFEDQNTVKQLLSGGALGFGEAYMHGELKIEGDLEAYFHLRHQFKHVRRSYLLATASLFSRISVPHNRKDQIAYHYDMGNDFFEMFLDKNTMSYSAGIYDPGVKNLDDAQIKKLELICDWLNLPSGAKVLDLGSGWGGFARHAAVNHKWNITGYTLSKSQLEYCRNLINQDNLDHLVTFEYRDMIDELPQSQYDAVVMLESIEHVGEERLKDHFENLGQVVKPGGFLYIQATGQYRRRPVDAFILKYVFPGGYLPPLGELLTAAGEAGFIVEELHDNTPDYLATMTVWIKNLEAHKPEIIEKFGSSHYRLWELWTHGAKVSFEENYMSLFRIKFKRIS